MLQNWKANKLEMFHQIVLSTLSSSIFICSSVNFVVGTSLNIIEISPSWSLSLARAQSIRNCVAVTICFTSGLSKKDGAKASLGFCFLTRILILGWLETEPGKTMETESPLHFSNGGGTEKIQLQRRHDLVGRMPFARQTRERHWIGDPQEQIPADFAGTLERQKEHWAETAERN